MFCLGTGVVGAPGAPVPTSETEVRVPLGGPVAGAPTPTPTDPAPEPSADGERVSHVTPPPASEQASPATDQAAATASGPGPTAAGPHKPHTSSTTSATHMPEAATSHPAAAGGSAGHTAAPAGCTSNPAAMSGGLGGGAHADGSDMAAASVAEEDGCSAAEGLLLLAEDDESHMAGARHALPVAYRMDGPRLAFVFDAPPCKVRRRMIQKRERPVVPGPAPGVRSTMASSDTPVEGVHTL